MLEAMLMRVKENWIIFVVFGVFFILLYTVTEISRRAEKKKRHPPLRSRRK